MRPQALLRSVRKGTPLLNGEQLFLLMKMREDGKIKAVIDRVYNYSGGCSLCIKA